MGWPNGRLFIDEMNHELAQGKITLQCNSTFRERAETVKTLTNSCCEAWTRHHCEDLDTSIQAVAQAATTLTQGILDAKLEGVAKYVLTVEQEPLLSSLRSFLSLSLRVWCRPLTTFLQATTGLVNILPWHDQVINEVCQRALPLTQSLKAGQDNLVAAFPDELKMLNKCSGIWAWIQDAAHCARHDFKDPDICTRVKEGVTSFDQIEPFHSVDSHCQKVQELLGVFRGAPLLASDGAFFSHVALAAMKPTVKEAESLLKAWQADAPSLDIDPDGTASLHIPADALAITKLAVWTLDEGQLLKLSTWAKIYGEWRRRRGRRHQDG
jgi:hypothetical protein